MGYAYWGGILLLGMASRLFHWILHQRKPREDCEVESQLYPSNKTWDFLPGVGGLIHWVQTHLIVPAPLATRGRHLLGCTYSSRAEALAVGGFWLLSIILSVVGYRTFSGNL